MNTIHNLKTKLITSAVGAAMAAAAVPAILFAGAGIAQADNPLADQIQIVDTQVLGSRAQISADQQAVDAAQRQVDQTFWCMLIHPEDFHNAEAALQQAQAKLNADVQGLNQVTQADAQLRKTAGLPPL
jgi:hypothetical protein